MITIELSKAEIFCVAMHGVMRHCQAERFAKGEPYGRPTYVWDVAIESCGSEFAVARYTGLFWHSLSKYPHSLPGDVGHLQVRHTQHEDGHMIVHDRDKDHDPFILVTGSIPKLTLRGWLYGKDCKKPEYYRTEGVRHPAYFVPQSELKPLETWPREPVVDMEKAS